MNFELSEEQVAIKDMADRFTADEITPKAAKWDEEHIFPRDTLKQAAELGFGSIYVDPERPCGLSTDRSPVKIIVRNFLDHRFLV